MNSGADSKKPRTCRSLFRESKAQWCHNCTLKKRADRCIRRVTWRANNNTAAAGEQNTSLPTKRAHKPALRPPEFCNSQDEKSGLYKDTKNAHTSNPYWEKKVSVQAFRVCHDGPA